jgi:predicted nucleotidyltransferase
MDARIQMALDVETVMDTVEKYVTDVKNVYPIDKVYLYGSYAKGTQRWDSDAAFSCAVLIQGNQLMLELRFLG